MKQVAITLTINVDDERAFLEKHGTLAILEERVNDAIRWLDGVSVYKSTQMVLGHEAAEVVGNRTASESRP